MVAAPRRKNSLVSGLASWGGGRLISGLALLLGGWGLWQMATARVWQVEWVEVVGCYLVSPERAVQESGLAEAWVVAVVPDETKARVESVPGVVSAEVRVSIPSRVRITIEEDRPVAVMRVENGDYWISARGQVLEPFGTVIGLPILRLAEGSWSASAVPEETLVGLMTLLAAFPEQDEFIYAPGKGYVMAAESGYQVYLGEAEDLDEKLVILEQLEQGFRSHGFRPQFVDLRTVAGAYYR